MRLAYIEPPAPQRQGDQVYRTQQPCAVLAARRVGAQVISGSWLSPLMHRAARHADVLVLCQAVDPDFLPLLDDRRARGLATVFEINDNFAAPQNAHAVQAFYRVPANLALAYQLARRAAALQLCSVGLQERFADLNPRAVLLPNQLLDLPEVAPPPAAPLCVGWAGSMGHRDDVAWIMPALRDMLAEHPDVVLCIMAPQALRSAFAWVPQARLRFVAAADLERYQAFLRGLHVGLAPLLPTEFNACRSDVKYLEYTQAGVATLCSDVTPYRTTVTHGEDGLLFADLVELRAGLKALLTSPRRRAELVANARAKVRAGRLEAQHVDARGALYESLMPVGSHDGSGWDAVWREAGGTSAGGYVPLPMGPLELALYDGLMAHRSATHDPWREAARLAPEFYLPQLYLGTHTRAPAAALAALQRADALAPEAWSVQQALGDCLWERGDAAAAVARWQRARGLAPDAAVTHEALGRAAVQAGDPAAATAHWQRALAANPDYRVPATRLATLALDSGRLAAAEQLLDDTVARGAGTWLESLLLGQVHSRRGAWRTARRHLEHALAHAPDPAPVRGPLAQACLAQGDMAAARQVLGR